MLERCAEDFRSDRTVSTAFTRAEAGFGIDLKPQRTPPRLELLAQKCVLTVQIYSLVINPKPPACLTRQGGKCSLAFNPDTKYGGSGEIYFARSKQMWLPPALRIIRASKGPGTKCAGHRLQPSRFRLGICASRIRPMKKRHDSHIKRRCL